MKSNDVLSGYTSNSDFASKFAEYMTVVKRCDATNLDDCFVDTFKTADGDEVDTSTLTTGTKLSGKNLADGTVAMMLKNGTTVLLSLRDPAKVGTDCDRIDPFNNTTDTTSCMSMLYDINGRGGPNTLGRDIGTLAVTAFTCSGLKIDGTCFSKAFTPTPLTLTECNAQKESLGIKYCGANPDYWSGAVSHCGGVSNLASPAQIAKLATDLYGVSCGTTGEISGLQLNESKRQAVGMTFALPITLWSSYEFNNAYMGLGSVFWSNTYRAQQWPDRSSPTVRAICIGE